MLCQACNTTQLEDDDHIFHRCPAYDHHRLSLRQRIIRIVSDATSASHDDVQNTLPYWFPSMDSPTTTPPMRSAHCGHLPTTLRNFLLQAGLTDRAAIATGRKIHDAVIKTSQDIWAHRLTCITEPAWDQVLTDNCEHHPPHPD